MTPPADLGLGTLDPELFPRDSAVARLASGYAPRGGLPAFRAAVAGWLGLEREQVVITTGASLALTAAFLALGRGPVLLPRPYYPAYRRILELLGRDVAYYGVGAGTDLGDAVAAAASPRVETILVNTPGNPVGRVWSRDEMAAAAGVAAGLGATLVVDETYRGLEFEAGCWAGEALPCERVLRVGSMSKLFGLPGARVGYAAGPRDLVEAVEAAHWSVAMSPPVVGQSLALPMLEDPPALMGRLRAALASNRDRAAARLRREPALEWVPPEGGVFLWVSLRGGAGDSGEMAEACRRAGVVVMDGAAFGQLRPSVRCSFAVAPAAVEPAFDLVARSLSAVAGGARP